MFLDASIKLVNKAHCGDFISSDQQVHRWPEDLRCVRQQHYDQHHEGKYGMATCVYGDGVN